MITIRTDNKDEYDKMMEFAEEYVCRQIPSDDCIRYRFDLNRCHKCFENNHEKCGIRIYMAVDSNTPSDL